MHINQLRILELGNSGIEDWGLRNCEFGNSGIEELRNCESKNQKAAGVAPSPGSRLCRAKEAGDRRSPAYAPFDRLMAMAGQGGRKSERGGQRAAASG